MARRSALLAVAAFLTGASATAGAATTASAQKLTEHARLTLVSKHGSRFQHKGRATGTVAGAVRSTITLDSLSLSGVVTITTNKGSLRLKVSGTARSGGLRSTFTGGVRVLSGTGRYAHARGRGTFHGVVNRSTWAATIDATGSLSS